MLSWTVCEARGALTLSLAHTPKNTTHTPSAVVTPRTSQPEACDLFPDFVSMSSISSSPTMSLMKMSKPREKEKTPILTDTCNPSSAETGTGQPLGLLSSQPSPSLHALQARERHVSKSKIDSSVPEKHPSFTRPFVHATDTR